MYLSVMELSVNINLPFSNISRKVGSRMSDICSRAQTKDLGMTLQSVRKQEFPRKIN
jgi:hypothetical protein